MLLLKGIPITGWLLVFMSIYHEHRSIRENIHIRYQNMMRKKLHRHSRKLRYRQTPDNPHTPCMHGAFVQNGINAGHSIINTLTLDSTLLNTEFHIMNI